MFILVHHQISKPDEFLAIVQSDTKFPDGLNTLSFLPSVSHKTATCLWEAPDINSLRNFMEPVLGKVSVNDYVEIDESLAKGLPKVQQREAALQN